jgi:hypothetical protein
MVLFSKERTLLIFFIEGEYYYYLSFCGYNETGKYFKKKIGKKN